MKEENNKARVGAFVMGGLILLVFGLIALGGVKIFSKDINYVLYFEGSVSGLGIGAPVMFRGVPLGNVIKINMAIDTRNQSITIPVYIRIDEKSIERIGGVPVTDDMREEIVRRMVRQGLRARLQLQSLITGQYRVDLDFFPGTPARYHTTDVSTELPTLPSAMDELQRTLTRLPMEEMVATFKKALQGVADLVSSEDLRMTVHAARRTFENAEALLAEFRPLREDIQRAAASFDAASAALAAQVPEAGESFRAGMRDLASAANQLERTLAAVDDVVARDSRTVRELNQALKEFTETARAVRALAAMLERRPESLLLGKGGMQ